MRMIFELVERIICLVKDSFKRRNGSQVVSIKDLDPVIIELSKRSKTRRKIASEYGWSVSTLNRKLKQKGIILPPGKVCPADLRMMYLAFGPPIPVSMEIN
jgi:hypothetical protein